MTSKKRDIRIHIFKDLTMCKRMPAAFLPGGRDSLFAGTSYNIMRKKATLSDREKGCLQLLIVGREKVLCAYAFELSELKKLVQSPTGYFLSNSERKYPKKRRKEPMVP